MTVLVLGSSGQLGRHLQELLPGAEFLTRATADLAAPSAVEAAVLARRPTLIVNAAAYTAVDRAESEPALAWRVNAEAPAALARVSAELDVPLVHVSTDYVFDGKKSSAYEETDPTSPSTVYGATKLAGELAVRTIAKKHWILRTSWVFSEHGSNFVKTMLRLARERPELKVVADQRGRPTYAADLARAIVALSAQYGSAASTIPYGTLHASGGREVSWYEFAGHILGRAQEVGLIASVPKIHPIPTSEYPTPARRPLNSALRTSATLAWVGFDWEAGLECTLRKLR